MIHELVAPIIFCKLTLPLFMLISDVIVCLLPDIMQVKCMWSVCSL